MAMPVTPATLLSDLLGDDAKSLKQLLAAGFTVCGDLLEHYPFRYEDRRQFAPWPLGAGAEAQTIHGIVTDARQQRHGFRKAFVEVTLSPLASGALGGPVVLRWFNMPFLHRSFAADMEVVAYGRVKQAKHGRLHMDHPEYEILSDAGEDAGLHMRRIVPIYHAREGVPQKVLRRSVHRVVAALDPASVPDLLPPPSPGSPLAGLNRAEALRRIHFPESMEAAELARQYLALEEFFGLQLNVLRRRQTWQEQRGAAHCGEGKILRQWQESLPFPLTAAQERCIAEIRGDLAAGTAMHRLLQGDVGSGKTFVAMAAMLLAIESGCQAALMAPTRILATQHALTFRRWLEPLGLRIALHTGEQSDDGSLPLFGEGDHAPHIVIGTHALLHGERLRDPGLVVIDEQHKFGVAQRAALIRRGTAPDVLVMTATPIPRTLTMTVYGDLDVSLLDELPAGRRPVTTTVREEPDPAQVAAFLRSQFGEGRQAYLVFPLIEESGKLAVRAATKEVEAWRARLPEFQLGLLHGRTSGDEKDRLMTQFRHGEIHALCATSVVEVGVDVPNASVMLVFDADRFGLAQLHQLRGRVGRGPHRSWCILITSGSNPEATDRLRALEQTTDGFAVAETDLRLRGPGDILGTAQSGLPALRLGDLLRDTALVKTARRLAATIMERDPLLRDPAHAPLRSLLRDDPDGNRSLG